VEAITKIKLPDHKECGRCPRVAFREDRDIHGEECLQPGLEVEAKRRDAVIEFLTRWQEEAVGKHMGCQHPTQS
jgi:hypothetical protein